MSRTRVGQFVVGDRVEVIYPTCRELGRHGSVLKILSDEGDQLLSVLFDGEDLVRPDGITWHPLFVASSLKLLRAAR